MNSTGFAARGTQKDFSFARVHRFAHIAVMSIMQTCMPRAQRRDNLLLAAHLGNLLLGAFLFLTRPLAWCVYNDDCKRQASSRI
jgi:hypothetical protein